MDVVGESKVKKDSIASPQGEGAKKEKDEGCAKNVGWVYNPTIT